MPPGRFSEVKLIPQSRFVVDWELGVLGVLVVVGVLVVAGGLVAVGVVEVVGCGDGDGDGGYGFHSPRRMVMI